MSQQLINRERAVLLVMDFSKRAIEGYASDPQGVVQMAALALKGARQVKVPVIYVLPSRMVSNPTNLAAEFHPEIAPSPHEEVILKSRTGAFSTTGLDALLRELGRDTLVLMGIATSGVVLSTVRWAADLNYKVIVLSDACSDPDPEVHRALTENSHPKSWLTFLRLASVMSVQEFLVSMGLSRTSA